MLCRIFSISRSFFYYQCQPSKSRFVELILTNFIDKIFHQNYRAYGSRRIKEAFKRKGIFTSRRRIARIMRLNDWRSKYTVKKYRPSKEVNEAAYENVIQREFSVGQKRRTIVTDLTYVEVQGH